MAVKKATTKKTAAKKKVAAKKTVVDSAIESVATEVLNGKWGTGRERDDALRKAGHDPAKVQKEAARQRALSSSWA